MQIVLALIVSLILVFLFWFIGHITKKELKLNEDQNLLSNLLSIALGAASFLIVLNLISTVIKDFNIGLIVTFVLCVGIIGWQFNEFKQVLISLKQFLTKDDLKNFFKQNTDKYFWILFGVINFIYGLTAFSTVKLDRFGLGNSHIFNINTLLAGNYPPKYSFAPSIAQKYHYGADILGAIISKCSFAHPEASLDVLLLVFLNLSLLALYALTIKFLNTNPINKYLVPFSAFLAWGPITTLFNKNPGEIPPDKFFEMVKYFTQTRLIDAASYSGSVLHWYFAPPVGLGIFFFLIALYLLFRFFQGERSLKYTILLGAFLSSLVIIDFSKFAILLLGLLVFLLFSPIPLIDDVSSDEEKEWKVKFKAIGILLLITVALGFVHGNWLRFGKEYESVITFFNLGTNSIDKQFGPFKTNIVFLVLCGFGFYKAYKLKEQWVTFLISFVISSYAIGHFIQVSNAGVGKILMVGNLLCAFAIPLVVDFARTKLEFKNKQLTAFYVGVFFILGFSSLMFFAFGDKERALFRLENNSLKYIGYQVFPATEETPSLNPNSEEYPFVQYLKSHDIKDQAIVAEHRYAELFSRYAFLKNLLSINNINVLNFPIRKEVLPQGEENFRRSFFLDKDFWKEHNIRWLYLTPFVVRAIMPPQVRIRLLNAYLNGGVKLVASNNKDPNDPAGLKELYEINPDVLDKEPENKSKLLAKLFSEKNKEKVPGFIKQIAECPYFGIYNAMSNDFDGDKIADIAFFDQKGKKWFVIHGKDQKEEEIDLSKNLLANYNGTDLLIPMPSDYDGDGKTDVALFNRLTALWFILRSSDLKIETRSWGGLLGQIPLAGDLDGDFKFENIAYASASPSYFGALLSPSLREKIVRFPGSLTDIPTFGDVDSDGISDLIVYKQDKSIFYILQSSTDYIDEKAIKITAGDNTSRIIVDDYNGDKKTDLAAWSPESGKWEIVSHNWEIVSHNIDKINLGNRGDIPMPGDYNGDGKSEIAIYNPRTAKLEILFSDSEKKVMHFKQYKGLTLSNFISF